MYTSYHLPVPGVSLTSSRHKSIPNTIRLRVPLLQIFATFLVCILAFFFFFNGIITHKVTQRHSPAIHGRWKEIHRAFRIPLLDSTQHEMRSRTPKNNPKPISSFPSLRLAPSVRNTRSVASRDLSPTREEILLDIARSFYSAADAFEKEQPDQWFLQT